jgi:hypothetical protein
LVAAVSVTVNGLVVIVPLLSICQVPTYGQRFGLAIARDAS